MYLLVNCENKSFWNVTNNEWFVNGFLILYLLGIDVKLHQLDLLILSQLFKLPIRF